jgi:hypothetical protein
MGLRVGVAGPLDEGWKRGLEKCGPAITSLDGEQPWLSLFKVEEEVMDAGETSSVSVLHSENRLLSLVEPARVAESSVEVQSEK